MPKYYPDFFFSLTSPGTHSTQLRLSRSWRELANSRRRLELAVASAAPAACHSSFSPVVSFARTPVVALRHYLLARRTKQNRVLVLEEGGGRGARGWAQSEEIFLCVHKFAYTQNKKRTCAT